MNQKVFAEKNDINKSRLNRILNVSVEVGFMKKIIAGVYEINPYIFLSKGLVSRRLIDAEELQDRW